MPLGFCIGCKQWGTYQSIRHNCLGYIFSIYNEAMIEIRRILNCYCYFSNKNLILTSFNTLFVIVTRVLYFFLETYPNQNDMTRFTCRTAPLTPTQKDVAALMTTKTPQWATWPRSAQVPSLLAKTMVSMSLIFIDFICMHCSKKISHIITPNQLNFKDINLPI